MVERRRLGRDERRMEDGTVADEWGVLTLAVQDGTALLFMVTASYFGHCARQLPVANSSAQAAKQIVPRPGDRAGSGGRVGNLDCVRATLVATTQTLSVAPETHGSLHPARPYPTMPESTGNKRGTEPFLVCKSMAST